MPPKGRRGSISKPKPKSPEYMARFVSAATLAYKNERNEDARNNDDDYQNVIADIMDKGVRYLREPQEGDEASVKFRPYRRLIKALLVQASVGTANRSGPMENIPADAPFNGEYTQEHIDIIKSYLDNTKNMKKFLLVFQTSEYLATHGMQEFFNIISTDCANKYVDMGDDGHWGIIDRITWRIKEYFVQNFFPSLKKTASTSSKRILDPQYMILIKFITDSTIFSKQNKMSIRRDSRHNSAVDQRTWKHTSIFMEQIYFVWEVYMKRVGFENAEEFLRLFLYYDRETGKLKSLHSNQVWPREDKVFMPVKEGIRAEEVNIPIPETENSDNEDTLTLGTERKQLNDDNPMKYIKQKTYETLRQCAKDFLVDMYNVVLNPTTLLTGKGSVKEQEMFTRYHMDGIESELPVRFASLEGKIIELREDIMNAKQKANSIGQETLAGTYHPEATLENAVTIVGQNNCGPDCNCTDIKANVNHEGYNFPSVLVSTPRNFMDKIKTVTGRVIPEQVQLIICDPYKYEGNKPHLQFEEIGSIVHNSALLLKDGGHVFVKTTLKHAGTIMNAFESEKADAEQSIFTVDEAAFNIIASPEDYRGRSGTDGPTALSVTIMYVHAMKLGTLTRKEAHENTDVRNHGCTPSRYHSATNIIDAAIEKTNYGYGLSLAGAQEIVSRYSKEDDIVVDFFADNSWVAMGCITLTDSRFCIGGVTKKEEKDELDRKLAECMIYQAGQGLFTGNMKYDEEFVDEMKDVYNTHKFDERYNPIYGMGEWIDTKNAVGNLPLLTTIPSYILDLICVIRGNNELATGVMKTKSPNEWTRVLGRTLARMNEGEYLRNALSRNGLFLDGESPYSNEGLRVMKGGGPGRVLGFMFGIVINGTWEDNRQILQSLGNGLFEYDEQAVKEKSISLRNVFVIKNTIDHELYDLKFIPAKFCPFRYARFTKTGGNTRVKINGVGRIGRKDLYIHKKYEVILTAEIPDNGTLILETDVRPDRRYED